MTGTDYTVLVTGGNGFLGQHIIKLLHEKADFVTHIRVLDIRSYKKQLDYTETKTSKTFTGDINDESVLEHATRGADCVIHVAAVVDARTFPDEAAMHKVNVRGTELLLKICMRQNVHHFIYCSTQDVVLGYKEIVNGTEALEAPNQFLFGPYAASKHLAEQAVRKEDGVILPNGTPMRTLSLRPVVLYGELDVHNVPEVLRTASSLGGTMASFSGSDVYQQEAYVGNVAWGFVCAVSAMQKNPNLGGESFFLCDDTPLMNSFQYHKPYLECRGLRLSSFVIPYWLIYLLVILWTALVWIISPLYKINSNFTYSAMTYLTEKVNFLPTKSNTMLAYSPLYTYKESVQRSLDYYKNIPLK